jgi:hypothetical protein
MTKIFRLAKTASMVALLSGCNALEPYQRPYSWHQTGVNAANLAAMVVDPTDLVHGHVSGVSDGSAAAAAIDRLRHDHVKPLPDGNSLSNAAPSAAAGLSGS